MSRKRLRRRSEKERRHAHVPTLVDSPRPIVRQATRVEQLAYTRKQAAEALGVSRSTFNRRVLPFVATVEMPSGTRLIPADELERLLAERRRPARQWPHPAVSGRPAAVPTALVDHIHAERRAGKSFGRIARDLNADRTPTAHGGAQWWPSTVRAVLRRSSSAAAPLPSSP